MFTKNRLEQGVTLYTKKSTQFKTVNFAVKWKSNLNVEEAAARAVLANVLEDSNGKYPTQTALRNKLDDLYGTIMYTNVAKRGDTHILSLNVECVNDEYLAEGGILEEAIDLLGSVVFNPNLENGRFKSDIVEREKKSVRERIRSQYDNKTSYAQQRMLEVLRPNSPISTNSDGTEEAVDKVTPESLWDTYNAMITQDTVDIYIAGDIDEAEITEKLKTVLSFNSRPERKIETFKTTEKINRKEAEHVREKQDMKQGKLHLGFSTPITIHHPDYTKMQVMNGVFGGFAHSKLFMNVREKESMAYYASSSYASHYGLISVMAGIDAKLEEKAVSLIKEQLLALQKGEVTDLELDQTKALLTNSITSTFDSARGQIEVYDQFKELDEDFTADYLIDKWHAVTKDDMKKMAKDIQLEVVYLLSGKEDNANE